MKRSIIQGLLFGLVLAFHHGPAQGGDRKVVLELFTSTTCGPCYNADVYVFQNWLPQSAARMRIIPIAYHVWWPGAGDPMYDANPSPVQGRVSFYQGAVYFAPRLYVDGSIDGSSTYANWAALATSRLQVASPITITLSGSIGSGTANLRASIGAEQAVTAGNLRLFWVVVEDSISALQTNGSAYVPFLHEAAHRTILPSANGATLSISQGQTIEVSQAMVLNPSWQVRNVRAVAFVQDITTKEILNAEEIALSSLTGVDHQRASTPDRFTLAQNYPNPFNPATTVDFAVPYRGRVTLTVHDLLGREVATLADREFDAGSHRVTFEPNGLSSGMYFCRMIAGGRMQTITMIFAR